MFILYLLFSIHSKERTVCLVVHYNFSNNAISFMLTQTIKKHLFSIIFFRFKIVKRKKYIFLPTLRNRFNPSFVLIWFCCRIPFMPHNMTSYGRREHHLFKNKCLTNYSISINTHKNNFGNSKKKISKIN